MSHATFCSIHRETVRATESEVEINHSFGTEQSNCESGDLLIEFGEHQLSDGTFWPGVTCLGGGGSTGVGEAQHFATTPQPHHLILLSSRL